MDELLIILGLDCGLLLAGPERAVELFKDAVRGKYCGLSRR